MKKLLEANKTMEDDVEFQRVRLAMVALELLMRLKPYIPMQSLSILSRQCSSM